MQTATALAWVLLPGLLWAAPTVADKDDKAVSPAEKLHAALDQTITLTIDKQPLSAAIDALRDKAKIHIVLDGLTIQQQLGFSPDQSPVTVQVRLKDVKVRTALRAILAPYGLSYASIGDTVVVTTEDMAIMRQMRQRISVDLSKVNLAGALRQIGRETGVNLVVDSRVEKESRAELSLRVEDVPLETAVRLLAEMAGLKPVRVGNTLFVTRKEIAAEMRGDPDMVQPNPGLPVEVSSLSAPPLQALFNNGIGNTIILPAPPPSVPPAAGAAPALPR